MAGKKRKEARRQQNIGTRNPSLAMDRLITAYQAARDVQALEQPNNASSALTSTSILPVKTHDTDSNYTELLHKHEIQGERIASMASNADLKLGAAEERLSSKILTVKSDLTTAMAEHKQSIVIWILTVAASTVVVLGGLVYGYLDLRFSPVISAIKSDLDRLKPYTPLLEELQKSQDKRNRAK